MFASSDAADAANTVDARMPPQLPKALSSEFLIGALVPPVLLGILVSRALADAMTQVGLVSEQLYRGERLPTLNMPATATDDE